VTVPGHEDSDPLSPQTELQTPVRGDDDGVFPQRGCDHAVVPAPFGEHAAEPLRDRPGSGGPRCRAFDEAVQLAPAGGRHDGPRSGDEPRELRL
jgi:hypothetical protein